MIYSAFLTIALFFLSSFSINNSVSEENKNHKNKLSWIEINDNNRKLLICDRNILKEVSWNELNEQNLEVSEENIESCLDTAGMGDVDVLIRTSGEVRLSNYLLWQNAYAEMFFTKTYWPDFSQDELDEILKEFNKRERRFGGI